MIIIHIHLLILLETTYVISFFIKYFLFIIKKYLYLLFAIKKKFDNFKKILKTQVSLTKKLLNKHLIKIKVITWKQFQNEDLKEYYLIETM